MTNDARDARELFERAFRGSVFGATARRSGAYAGDIDASWDGLRRFWSIGLAEDGCLMRDRACKAEAENAKLRELVRDYERCNMHADCGLCEYDGVTSTHCPLSPCFPDIDELRELGVEVTS